MGISAEFIIGIIGTVVLALVSYLLARSIGQIDKNLEQLNEDFADLQIKLALLERSVTHLESRKHS